MTGSNEKQLRCTALAFAGAMAALLGGCAAGSEGEAPPREFGEHPHSLMVLGDETFTAYYGGNRFDPDAVFGVAQPEIRFDAVRAPIAELDGPQRVIDLSEPSGWAFLLNLQYGADVDVLWHTLVLEAGAPGVGGTLTVRGSREPVGFALQYDVWFAGDMDLPGFSDNPVDLQVRAKNLGMAPAEEIRRAPAL